jgi:oligosaccharide repeat unit polymerase
MGVIYFLLRGMTPKKEINKQGLDNSVGPLKVLIKRLLIVWVLGSLFEIIYSGGLPLWWAFSGVPEKNYTDFGLPTFHGLMNALYLFSVTGLFFNFMVTRDRNTLRWSLLLLAWPVFMLGRGIVLCAVGQMAGVYFCLKRVSIKTGLVMVLAAIFLITVFGWTGDIRGRSTPFSYLVNTQRQSEVFEFLPSGFLWFYVYVTSPLANVINNIDHIQPSYVPYHSIINLVPSFGRALIAPGLRADSLELVDQSLNVSTFYAGFLSDFGLIGALLAVCILQITCVMIYFPAHDKRPWAVLAYAVVFESILFSVFYNLFFLHTYIIQVLLAFYFGVKEKRLRRRLENSRSLTVLRHPVGGQPVKASGSSK